MLRASDEYWLNHLKKIETETTKEYILRETLKENAEFVVKVTEQNQQIIHKLLLKCDANIRTWLSPFMEIKGTYYLLLSLYYTIKEKGLSDEDVLKEFQAKLRDDVNLRDHINTALDNIEESENVISKNLTDISKTAVDNSKLEKETLKSITENRNNRTWKDIPKEQLYDRLAKGETIPQDHWIPGISKGGRKLKKPEFVMHLEFAEKLRAEANQLYKEGNYLLAYTRYNQGVNTLNWVEGETEENTIKIKQALSIFYRNLAAAALKVKEYRAAEDACTKVIELDEYDSKALYRRAQVYIVLGELTKAKSDIIKVIKSPYASTDDIEEARKCLHSIRHIVSSWKSDTRQIIQTAAENAIFGSLREEESRDKDRQTKKPLFYHETIPLKPVEVASVFSKHSNISIYNYTPQLTCESLESLLLELIDFFTSDEIQKELIEMRKLSDLEQHRFLIRFEKSAEKFFAPKFQEYDISGQTFMERKEIFETEVKYWSMREKYIKNLFDKLEEIIIGDVALD